MKKTQSLAWLVIGLTAWSQEVRERTPARYKEVEVWPPLAIEVRDEHDVVTLYCKTKQLTHVVLPLAEEEYIESIGTGDGEGIWSVAGKGSRAFTAKPSDLAHQTSAIVRTNRDRVFHFRLVNLAVSAELFQFTDPEEMEAFHRRQKEQSRFDPYYTVVLKMRENQLARQDERRLREKEKKLEAQIKKYQDQLKAQKAEKAAQDQKCARLLQDWTAEYAARVDPSYRVIYRKSRLKKMGLPHKTRELQKRPLVQRVFADEAFIWVTTTPKLPALHVYEVIGQEFRVVNVVLQGNLYRIDRIARTLEFRDQPKGDWLFRIQKTTP